MSERYTRLFSTPENLYAEGSPVILAAGALLKDTMTGNVLAQFKLRNISDRQIKAATVSIAPVDTRGLSLGETVRYQYLDLTAERDADFGQKTPIVLPSPSTRSFTVSVSEVIFADNEVWNGTDNAWEPLSAPVSLETALEDKELVRQYRIQYGETCRNLFKKEKDLWRCACGAWNRQDDDWACHKCQREATVLSAMDLDELKANRDERLELARQKAEEKKAEAERKRMAAKKKVLDTAKKALDTAKKYRKIAAICGAAIVAVVVIALVVTKVVIPMNHYNDAVALMEAGSYEEAIAAFEAMDGYKDSKEQISACRAALQNGGYDKAVALMDAGNYEEAIAAFEAMDGYKDSKEQILSCQYNIAIALMEEGKQREAIAMFEKVHGYQDADQYMRTLLADTVSAGVYYTVGLKADGSVVAVGNNEDGQCNVGDWRDIVAVAADRDRIVGLKANDTVVAVGNNEYHQCDVSDWRDIVAVSAGTFHTVGLKADGTVVAAGAQGLLDGAFVDYGYGQCDVSDWRDIVAVSAGGLHTVGLKADGTVVAVGAQVYDSLVNFGQCNVGNWRDIVAVSAGGGHTVGLKADGTVVAIGKNDYGECNIGDWKDIRLPYSPQ